jgi:hypothetical protein
MWGANSRKTKHTLRFKSTGVVAYRRMSKLRTIGLRFLHSSCEESQFEEGKLSVLLESLIGDDSAEIWLFQYIYPFFND